MVFPDIPQPTHVRQRDAYEIGRQHYLDAQRDCPFPKDHTYEIVAFWDGWYDAKHEQVMERLGETWSLRDQCYFQEVESGA